MDESGKMRIAIIGAGHNGLIAAACIARNGHDVFVYEKRDIVGGLCVTEELFPGYRVSTAASHFGKLLREIIDDLGLGSFNLEVVVSDPVSTTLLPDGKFIIQPRSSDHETAFSFDVGESDRSGWRQFYEELGRASSILKPYLLRTGVTQYELQKEFEQAGLTRIASKLFDGSLIDVLGEYFSDDNLKAAASTGVYEPPTRKGTLFDLIYGGTSEAGGRAGASGLLRGGMGSLSQALLAICHHHGARVLTGHPVSKILVEKRRATGIVLADGRTENFDAVISNLDPRATFGRLLDPEHVPEAMKTSLKKPLPPVSSGKIHFALRELPDFPVLSAVSHELSGSIVLAPEFRQIIESADQLMKGSMPDNLILSLCFPSLADDSVAPAGKHLLTVDIHHMPSTFEGEPWSDQNASVVENKVLATIEQHCPEIRSLVEQSFVLTPGHLQDIWGISTGHCDHLPMTSEFLVEQRRLPYCGQHTGPIEKLYLCGAGTYPGGGVTGAPGYNCARIFRSIRRQRR